LNYLGYDLEEKPLMVGWQVTITKDGTFVRHTSIAKERSIVVEEAHKYVDAQMQPVEISATKKT
jgi:hypothetical protein